MVGRQNLVTYSNTFTNAIWSKINITIAAAPSIMDPFGGYNTYKITDDATNNIHLTQYQTAIVNQPGTISYWLKAGTLNFATISLNGNYFAIINLTTGVLWNPVIPHDNGKEQVFAENHGNGWWRVSIITNSTSTSFTAYPTFGTANAYNVLSYSGSGGYIYCYGCQAVRANWAGEYIETTTTAINSGPIRNKIYPQNLSVFSGAIAGGGYWSYGYTTIIDGYSAPDGTTTAARLSETASNSGHYIVASNIGNESTGRIITFSIYAKAGTSSKIYLYSQSGGAKFNLTTGEVYSVASSTNFAKIQSAGNGWYRCQFNTICGPSLGKYFYIYMNSNTWEDSYTGSTSNNVFLWHPKVEESDYAGDYIGTVDANYTFNIMSPRKTSNA
jgi:hypothetical protein